MSAKKTSTKKNTAKSAASKATKKTKPVVVKATATEQAKQPKETKAPVEQSVVSKNNQSVENKDIAPPKKTVQQEKQALESKPVDPPAKATSISPAVKESKTPALKKSQTPAIKNSKVPAVKESKAPAIKEAKLPVVQEVSKMACAIPNTRTALGPNPYLPYIATIMEVIEETSNIKTFRVVLDDAAAMQALTFGAGQVGQLSVFGVGEATFVISSPPSQKEFLQFSVMRVGEVTRALHKLAAGDKIGVRAPLGNAFPCASWHGKDLFFIGGGIGMAPIRSIMLHTLENKADYGKISLLYGARTPNDMAFSYELEGWLKDPNLDCTLTIDIPFGGWDHKVGLIPDVLTDLNPDPAKTVAIICGPPIMITFTVQALMKMNFTPENIITTLEKRMKCGIGICGRCNLGNKYVCVDGPVFSWAELNHLPPEL